MPTFPVTESTLSATGLQQFIAEKYKLSTATTCKLFRTGINHLYMVTDGASKYVYRVYTFNWRSKTEIEEEVRLLLYLKDNDAPISNPIADTDGTYIHELDAPEGMRYGVLFSFAEGTKIPRFSVEASYAIGEALANIHRSTHQFKLDRVTYNTQTLVTDALHRTKQFFTKQSSEISFLEKIGVFIRREFDKANISELRYGAVHLDVWFDNMHIDADNNVTIFDFDFCGNGWLCLDLSYFLFQLYWTNPNEEDYKTKAESFLKGYDAITPLTAEEKRLLPFACLGIMTFYISVQCDKYDTWSNVFLNEDHLKRFVGNLKRWVDFNGLAIE